MDSGPRRSDRRRDRGRDSRSGRGRDSRSSRELRPLEEEWDSIYPPLETAPEVEPPDLGAEAGRASKPRRGRPSPVLIFAPALVLVVALAVVVGFLGADRPGPQAEDTVVWGVTGRAELPDGEAIPELGVVTPRERVQPADDRWEELLPRLEKQAKAAPEDRNAQRKLALAYYNLGRLEEALSVYELLLAAEEDPVLRNRVGNTLRDMGDKKGAESAYREAIAGDPTLVAPHLNLAELLWREARDEEALATIDAGLETVPEENRGPLETARAFLSGEE